MLQLLIYFMKEVEILTLVFVLIYLTTPFLFGNSVE